MNIYRAIPEGKRIEISNDGGTTWSEKAWMELFHPKKDSFDWGYINPQSHNLAIALLLAEGYNEKFIGWWGEIFCREVIAARLIDQPFTITGGQINEWCDEKSICGSLKV